MKHKDKRITASHIMLYVALIIYIAVIVSGIVFLKYCVDSDDIESARVVYVSIASASTVCGSAVVGFYATKASRENILQINNGKYRMRLKLAKQIFKEFKGKSLDEKSLQLMRTLISDEHIAVDNTDYTSNSNVGAGFDISIGTSHSGSFNNDEGLG